MPEIDTTDYERAHGNKPFGRRFWKFKLVTAEGTSSPVESKVTATYDAALESAKLVAGDREAVRIVVEP